MKAFFDVFPTLQVKTDLRDYFAETEIERLTTNKERTRIKVVLHSGHLIHKSRIYRMQDEISRQIFRERNPEVYIDEHYTLSAQFSMGDQMLDIQINNYDPYNGNGVSEKGFSVNGSCLNKSYTEGITGSVLFPSDGMSTFATVTADGQSMASVAITAADGSAPYGVSAGAGDVVTVTPVQSGPVTLTITYYSAAPEDGVSVDPAAATGTAQYTIYFS